MHKVKTQRSEELFVKTCLFLNFIYGYIKCRVLVHDNALYKLTFYLLTYLLIIKNYKVKIFFKQISGKIGINFRKFSAGKFRTHNPSVAYRSRPHRPVAVSSLW